MKLIEFEPSLLLPLPPSEMTSSSSPSDKAIRITIVATVAAVAAYVGYRAYKKHYPFEELMSKGKSSRKEEANVPADKVDEIPIEKGIRVFN